LDEGNRERRELASAYRRSLSDQDVDLPAEHPGAVHHQFAIAVASRDRLRRYLREEAQIDTGLHYGTPLHRQAAFVPFAPASLPVTDDLAERMISLPIQPEVAQPHMTTITQAIRRGLELHCKV
jgi:dTDP-4-amino-4,6-dideoxygalactose transaminase